MGTRLRSKSRVLSAGHRSVAGEETVESEVLDDDEVIEDEETPTSPMSRRSVAEPEPEEEYYSPRQSIGRVGKTAMSKLKPGVQQQIAQGLRRSQRLERALGASSSSVREALEAENDRVLTQAALDPEPLLGDVFLPVSPEAVLEALVVEKGIKFLKKVDPDRYPLDLSIPLCTTEEDVYPYGWQLGPLPPR